MIYYRIRVGKNYFDDPHYVTNVKRRHGDIVEVNMTSTSISKSFYQVKNLKTIEKVMEGLANYCNVRDGNITFYEIEKIDI